MAGHILSPLQRDKLDHFPQEVSVEDLNTYFRFSDRDLELIDDLRTSTNRFYFALQLAALRYLGFCPANLFEAPVAVRLFVAGQLRLELADIDEKLTREQTRTQQLRKAREYLGWRLFSETVEDSEADSPVGNGKERDEIEAGKPTGNASSVMNWLVERALEHDEPLTLLEMTLEKLKTEKIIRPGLSVVERLVLSARDQAARRTYQLLQPLLTPPILQWLDTLLIKDEQLGWSRLEWLRQQPATNSPPNILSSLAKVKYLKEAGVNQWKSDQLNPNRRKHLAELGRRSSKQTLALASPIRRYPILLGFALETLVETTDLVVEMFDGFVAGVYSRAGRELKDFRLAVAPAANQTLHLFATLGGVVLDETVADSEVRKAIYAQLPAEQLKKAVEDCHKLTRPLDDQYFDFLAERYSKFREFIPTFLQTLNFQSNLANTPLIEAVEVLRGLNRDHKRQVPGSAPVSFVDNQWEAYVYNSNGTLNRKYYELCTLWSLRQAVRGGNVWVEGGRRYAPWSTHLIDPQSWTIKRVETHQLLGLPLDGAVRFRQLQADITAALAHLDEILNIGGTASSNKTKPDHQSGAGTGENEPQPLVRLEGNKLRLSRYEALEISESTQKLRKLIVQRLPQVELVDLIMEVDHWLRFSRLLTHAQEGRPCPESDLPHLYAAIVAQACNLGLANMERMSGFDYWDLSAVTNWHLREHTLKEAITKLVNYQHAQPLSQHWGDGSFSSSDGQRFTVAVPSRSSAALPRYFGYHKGLTMLSWTADQFAVYGTKTVKPTNREALYTLDAILDNQSELPIHSHTTDTNGYTEIVFALFDLLGLEFEPRLRDISDQRLWRPEGVNVPVLLQGAFKGNLVKSERLVASWDELARLVGSLKLGYSSASLLVSKLQAFPRQNALTGLLQEYGRLVKTRFILGYVASEQAQRRVGKQLDKGETVNALRDHLFYGNKGQIRKRVEEEQLDQGLCTSLVMNCIIVWNTVYMSLALESLRKEGLRFTDEDLTHLSPCRYQHINVYGRYFFALEAIRRLEGYRPLRSALSSPST